MQSGHACSESIGADQRWLEALLLVEGSIFCAGRCLSRSLCSTSSFFSAQESFSQHGSNLDCHEQLQISTVIHKTIASSETLLPALRGLSDADALHCFSEPCLQQLILITADKDSVRHSAAHLETSLPAVRQT